MNIDPDNKKGSPVNPVAPLFLRPTSKRGLGWIRLGCRLDHCRVNIRDGGWNRALSLPAPTVVLALAIGLPRFADMAVQ